MSDRATPALRTRGLGKRYGSQWALQDCTLDVAEGRVTALVGPNGAGKTTLLRLLVGLSAPTEGAAELLGRAPEQDEEFLALIGYLAQDVPLYRRLSAEDHLMLGAHLNRQWDADGARDRLDRLGIPLDRPVAKLSGGQRAQIGLGLALAKRPALLLLDEPVAALDPLARREFLASLDRGCGRRGTVGHPLLAPAARSRTGLRPRHPVGRLADAAVRGHRRRTGLAPDVGGPTSRRVAASNRRSTRSRPPRRTARPGCWPAWTVRCSTPPGRSTRWGWRRSSWPTWATTTGTPAGSSR